MLQRVSLSKAGAKLRTFSQTPTFTRLFFDRFSKFFRKTLKKQVCYAAYFFVIRRRRRKTCTIIFIARAGACAQRKTHRIIHKKRHNGKTTPSLHQNNGIFLPEIHHIITNTISTSPNSSSTFQRTFYCVQNKSS